MIAVRFSIGMQSDFDIPPEFKKANEKSLPKVTRRGTKKPKRTNTIHQAVKGTEHVTMKTTKTNLRMNDPNLAPIEEERPLAEKTLQNILYHIRMTCFPKFPTSAKGFLNSKNWKILTSK